MRMALILFCCLSLLLLPHGCAWPNSGAAYVHPAEPTTLAPPDTSGCVKVSSTYTTGSGAVIARRGSWWYVATAAHVAALPIDLTVDGHEAYLYGVSPYNDLAIIRFRAFKRYRIYGLAKASVGQRCWAVGYPGISTTPKVTCAIFIIPGHVTHVSGEGVYFNGGAAKGISGGPLLAGDPPKILGIAQGLVVLHDITYETMLRTIPAEEIAKLMAAIP